MNYNEIFNDCYQLLINNLNPPKDDAYFQWFINLCEQLGRKYEHCQFAQKFIVLIANEVDRIASEDEYFKK